jgi:hypothetical protein
MGLMARMRGFQPERTLSRDHAAVRKRVTASMASLLPQEVSDLLQGRARVRGRGLGPRGLGSDGGPSPIPTDQGDGLLLLLLRQLFASFGFVSQLAESGCCFDAFHAKNSFRSSEK